LLNCQILYYFWSSLLTQLLCPFVVVYFYTF
jgi:hypothetical protein